MKKITLLLAFFSMTVLPGTLHAADLYVVAKDANGNVVKEAKVSETSVLKFTGESVEVRSPQALEATFPYDAVNSLSFRYGEGAGVGAINVAGSMRLRENPVDSRLELMGFEGAPTSLIIFDSKGGIVNKIEKWNNQPVDVSSLTPGLYFVTVNKTTLKFIKK